MTDPADLEPDEDDTVPYTPADDSEPTHDDDLDDRDMFHDDEDDD